MHRSVLLVWLGLAALAHASVTVAWKLPADVFAPGYRGLAWDDLGSDSLLGEAAPKKPKQKLAKPPGESAFFEPGDELWDISKELIERARSRRGIGEPEASVKWPGEWIVWNERSQMIIARGSEVDIMMASSVLDHKVLPALSRTKLELVHGANPKVVHQLSVLSASAETASARADGVEAKLRAVNWGWSNGRTEHDILVSWQAGEQKAEVSVHVDLYEGRSRIARFGSGDDQWELFASGGLACPHGVLHSEIRWREEDGKVVSWPVTETAKAAIVSLDENLKLGIFEVSSDLPIRLGGGEDGGEDPFGAGAVRAQDLVKLSVPQELENWIGGRLTDVSPLLKQNGMKLDDPRAFAGFDPVSSRLFVIATRVDMDLCEQIVTGIGCYFSRGAWAETDAASGNWGLACRFGEESWIKLSRDDRSAEFKIRPEFEEAWPNIDITYKVDSLVQGIVHGSFESKVKLLDAISSPIGSYQSTEGKEATVTLTVDAAYP